MPDKKTDKNRDDGELPLVTDHSEQEHPDADDGDQAEAPATETDES